MFATCIMWNDPLSAQMPPKWDEGAFAMDLNEVHKIWQNLYIVGVGIVVFVMFA